MCCAGCAAVAMAIHRGGLDDFYRYRESVVGVRAALPDADREDLLAFDTPVILNEFSRDLGAGQREGILSIEGMTCAACAWLIERCLQHESGVDEACVNLSGHRLRIVWQPERVSVSALIAAVDALGYRVRPQSPDRDEARRDAESRAALRRLGISGLAMMQVMTFSVALYAGAFEGISPALQNLLRIVSALVATPVVFYSAAPFFRGAYRDLRAGIPGMDVPVALAIGLAYAASLWATARGGGEVYFDSVCMFTFFLSAGRFLEMHVRHRADERARWLVSRIPELAHRLGEEGEEHVPSSVLVSGDRILVRPGENIPTDGIVLEGESSVDEALLTGEPWPHSRKLGDAVIGGSHNIESPLVIEVGAVGSGSTLFGIRALLERAQAEKPRAARIADRVAAGFVSFVLVAAVGVAIVWLQIDPQRAFWVTLSVLVATCPCALSLATPTALAAATSSLASAGLLITRGHFLETLARTDTIVFDKTGTLTRGVLRVAEVQPLGELEEAALLSLAVALESTSEHPVAAAIVAHAGEGVAAARALEIRAEPGQGIAGVVAGRALRIGRADWAWSESPLPPVPADDTMRWVMLADDRGPLAWFGLEDELRDDARDTLAALRSLGMSIRILSGDPSNAVERLGKELDVDEVVSGATPEEKIAYVAELTRSGAHVAVVGDGVNDAPVLQSAPVAIAMGAGSDLARVRADAVLLSDALRVIPTALLHARSTVRIIRQNLIWAVVYNVVALPLAASGLLAPWAAAIGMSTSSLLVVMNAFRLSRTKEVAL